MRTRWPAQLDRNILDHLRTFGELPAVMTANQQLSYFELADHVDTVATELTGLRRLMLVETRNDLRTLVHYLGGLCAGHVVIPVPAGRDHSAILKTYDPELIVDADGVHRRHRGGRRHLHDDLSLLLSTSGSTGSPKLVRLSRTNLIANAAAIADYLDIGSTDRAATTLPMSYCYGLSVIHSHLLRGAGLILSEHSVVDDEFWQLFRAHRGTTFAGVPHTFEMLEHVGFEAMHLPSLRYLTQAGGRMSPQRVQRFARLGESRGWQLFVMYGATEATARMAYLPPDLASTRPTAIGRPIPGGSFSIEPLDGVDTDQPVGDQPAGDHPDGLLWTADSGELVYHGPNVMLGYAESPADLALGRTVDRLRTGDIARRCPDGLYEVLGRSSRFAKLFGLRVDLQRLETTLHEQGVEALCTADENDLIVAATGTPTDSLDIERVRHAAAAAAGIPSGAVRMVPVGELPRLPSGKPDYQAVRRLSAELSRPCGRELHTHFAEALGIDPTAIDPDRSFVEMGGNSLSYVAVSVRLERVLGRLPTDWHRMPLRDLQRIRRGPHRRWSATIETSVALRAAAIVLIVASHSGWFELWGGAHILLGVAGYNFGRFALTPMPQPDRIRHLRNTIAWIAVPSVLWIALVASITHDYGASNLILAQKFLGPADSMTAGRLWFIEVLVWTLVALALVCRLSTADRLERRHPFAVALVFLAAGLALRYDVLVLGLGREAWFTLLAFWFFAAGWAAAKASTTWQRVAVTAVLAVGLSGYFQSTGREALVMAGLALLIWLPALRFPGPLTALAGLVAEASLYIYLTHFQVYPLFGSHHGVGVAASVLVGVLIARAVALLRRWIRARSRSSPGLIPVGDKSFLHQGGGDGPVGSDQASGDQATSARTSR